MKKTSITALTLGALGIVYGDIGTSPLYAMNEVFFGSGRLSVTPEHVAGAASLILWLLIIVVGFKYTLVVLRADHEGEGGVFALLTLLQNQKGRGVLFISYLLMFAAGLLFGDGIITPAISVISAIEGLKVATPALSHWVVPLTLAVLTGIFLFQKQGTRRVGKVYGPIMLVWFVTLAVLGLRQIIAYPAIILPVLNPLSALQLITSLSLIHALFLLGAVFLVITGCEALYADLGHFGKRAVRVGWFGIAFPALVLNYAGQGAYLLRGAPVTGSNIFYSMVPTQFIIPMIFLSTAAAIIASVALIFGAYSLTSQAIALRILPRMRVRHTDRETEGQIYVPFVNWTLFVGSVLLVITFGSASHLAAAYGFAVSGVMLITSITLFSLMHTKWHLSPLLRWSAIIFFGTLDVIFVMANSLKFFQGGYIPLFLGCGVFLIIITWRWGRGLILTAYEKYVADKDMQWFLDLKQRMSESNGILRDHRLRHLTEMDRAVTFLISRPITKATDRIPVKLRVFLKRKGAIPKNILLLNIEQDRLPYFKQRYRIIDFGMNVYSVRATFGFMENPNAGKVLRDLYRRNIFEKKFSHCTIQVSEDEIIVDKDVPLIRRFLVHMFKLLQRNAEPAYRYFGLSGESSAGIGKTLVPIRINNQGAHVEIPEFSLVGNRGPTDPDAPSLPNNSPVIEVT